MFDCSFNDFRYRSRCSVVTIFHWSRDPWRKILTTHLLPTFGDRKLDSITNEDVQELKHRLKHKAPKTVNNVLTVLNVLLKTAVEWEVIDAVPCSIRLLKTPKSSAQFHDFEDFERLVEAAQQLDARART